MKDTFSFKKILLLLVVVMIGTISANIVVNISNASMRQEITTESKDVNGVLYVNSLLIDENGNVVTGGLKCNTNYTLFITNYSDFYVDGTSAMTKEKNDFSDTRFLVLDINTLDSIGAISTSTESFDLFDFWETGLKDSERIQIRGLAPNQTISFQICFYYYYEDPEMESFPENDRCSISLELAFTQTECSKDEIENFERNQMGYSW